MTPRDHLVHVLRSAYSGELAAGHAYRGHWKSVRNAEERDRIRIIEAEEWHHRDLVRGLLADLDAKPSPRRELLFWMIGQTIGLFCRIGGWFIPMYGAGRLERWNIVEYENAAAFAVAAGHDEMLECLLAMAEVEWEHERYFRERVAGHWLLRVFRVWPAPPPKDTIRAPYRDQTPARDALASRSAMRWTQSA